MGRGGKTCGRPGGQDKEDIRREPSKNAHLHVRFSVNMACAGKT